MRARLATKVLKRGATRGTLGKWRRAAGVALRRARKYKPAFCVEALGLSIALAEAAYAEERAGRSVAALNEALRALEV